LSSLHRHLAPLQRSSSYPSSPSSHWHTHGSSCSTASCSGSPRSQVRGVVRYLAPCRCSSSSLSSCLLCAFLRKVLRLSIQKEEGGTEWVGAVEYSFCKMDSQC
jgi:hypothetical protein